MKQVLSITGALVAVLAGAILRYQDLISDAFLLTAAAVLGFLLLSWAFGIGMTELHKRAFVPRPWTLDAAEALASALPTVEQCTAVLQQAQRSRDRIWFAATLWGGAPYTALLIIYFWPPSVLGWVLCSIAGIGLGGALLPVVYRGLLNDFWPWLRGRFLKKEV